MKDVLPPTKQLIDQESIEIVKQVADLAQELADRLGIIAEKSEADALGTRAMIGNQINQLQVKLFKINNIPDDEMGCWSIDTRYIADHGIAYLQRDEERYLHRCMLDKRLSKVEPS